MNKFVGTKHSKENYAWFEAGKKEGFVEGQKEELVVMRRHLQKLFNEYEKQRIELSPLFYSMMELVEKRLKELGR